MLPPDIYVGSQDVPDGKVDLMGQPKVIDFGVAPRPTAGASQQITFCFSAVLLTPRAFTGPEPM